MGSISLSHLLILLLILLIFFGPSKLPQLGQSLGRAIRGFKEGMNEINAESREVPPRGQDQQGQQLNHAQQTRSEQHQHETSDQKKS